MSERIDITINKDGTFTGHGRGMGKKCDKEMEFLAALGDDVKTRRTQEYYGDDKNKNVLKRG